MNTSARMLRLLSLLQTHRYWPGGELSERLEVSPRTLRRDIDRLRELGYAVDAVRGVSGGYQLRAGTALPPLLLEDEEAVAIAVALRAAASGGEDTSLQALTKVIALMPPRLRRQMDALRSQTDGLPWSGGPVLDAGVITALAQACRDDEPVTFDYTARDGASSRRRVEPHRLVSAGRRWYLVGYDKDRQDWRSFRVDRVGGVQGSGQRVRPRELPGGDAAAFVAAGIRSMAQRYDVRLRIELPAEVVEADIGRWATVTADGDGCLVHMPTDSLDWPVMVLARLGAEFRVDGPPELREVLAVAAERFSRS
ncbi:YafY family protein [Nocardioides caricicola]|uniref:YafY family protein n=1 Tax=Nocardioides caricicola TaxID=634770 RepID=A0ABW0MYF5_9ACTN